MAMAAIQADRESAAVRARNICVLGGFPPSGQHLPNGGPAEMHQ
jgi:hypothetical protein